MSTAEFLQWAALITVIEPQEREQKKANSQSSF